MNEFDQFIKHSLKVKYYARYTDDFVVVSGNYAYLKNLVLPIRQFFADILLLDLHPNKVFIRKFNQGIDFLGYVVLPHHTKLRTKTKRRIFHKLQERINQCHSGIISEEKFDQTLQSYLGVLSHSNSYHLEQELLNQYWFLDK